MSAKNWNEMPISLAAARAERDAVLSTIGGDEDALRCRAEAEGLDAWEMAVLHELDVLDARIAA